jgi:geranylgeranyl diphosphate synthase type II
VTQGFVSSSGATSAEATPADRPLLGAYLDECREWVRDEIRSILPRRGDSSLYELMFEYPLRSAKALRPALCIAVCRAGGGRLEDVLPSAAVLELYHNAFLVHDDIEDESLLRRGLPTLHREHGVPVAVNVGDGMLALSLQPLLDNTALLGLGKALRILEVVARMSRVSVEGQALELDWVRHRQWDLRERDYLGMAFRKTCWYTFIAPVMIGGIVAGLDAPLVSRLNRFAAVLGVAFQIHDDVLNLDADEGDYGKEIAGDLEEGKRTLMLLHMMRSCATNERAEAERILALPRSEKRPGDIALLVGLIRRYRSVAHARAVAARYARRADEALAKAAAALPPSVHMDFLRQLVGYVTERDR